MSKSILFGALAICAATCLTLLVLNKASKVKDDRGVKLDEQIEFARLKSELHVAVIKAYKSQLKMANDNPHPFARDRDSKQPYDRLVFSEGGGRGRDSFVPIEEGRVAYISRLQVVQILGDETMLCMVTEGSKYRKMVIAVGWPTASLVDDQELTPQPQGAFITGTKDYETVLGANRRVYVIEPVDLDDIDL